jgi:hypothetical protein
MTHNEIGQNLGRHAERVTRRFRASGLYHRLKIGTEIFLLSPVEKCVERPPSRSRWDVIRQSRTAQHILKRQKYEKTPTNYFVEKFSCFCGYKQEKKCIFAKSCKNTIEY